MKFFTVLLFCAQTGLKEQPERYQTGRGVDYSGYGRYITGESGGKRAKRAAELTGGFPALEDGAEAPAAGTDTGRLASGAAHTRTTVEDVTKEYFDNAKPGVGTVIVQEGYRLAKHKKEILIADYLHETFGGDITLLKEKGGKEWPDYEWNKLLWELKTNHTPTKNAIDKAIQKGLSQISTNPGGILIDFEEGEIEKEKLLEIIAERFARGSVDQADVIILNKGQTKAVLRYKK